LRSCQFDEAALYLTDAPAAKPDIPHPAIDRSDIRPRPNKAVALGQDDPRTLVVEPELLLRRRRNFDRIFSIVRRRVGDRQNANRQRPVVEMRNDRQHRRWAFPLSTLLAAFEILANARVRSNEGPITAIPPHRPQNHLNSKGHHVKSLIRNLAEIFGALSDIGKIFAAEPCGWYSLLTSLWRSSGYQAQAHCCEPLLQGIKCTTCWEDLSI